MFVPIEGGLENGFCPAGGGDAVCLPGVILVHNGLLDGGSVTVRRLRPVALANEMGRGGVSVALAAAFANSPEASLPGMPL